MSTPSTILEPQPGAASPLPVPPPVAPEKWLSASQWGMLTFLCSEVSFFTTLIVAYVVFYGRDSQPGGLGGPTPADALSLGLACVTTTCLLASSATIHLAERALRQGRHSTFIQCWAITIVLGVAFLCGTAYEWRDLIVRERLTISRNLFGTTFYTLVGFHATHVTVGVIVMLIVLGLALRAQAPLPTPRAAGGTSEGGGVEMVSWYWHFVDGVWIVVFSVVYLMPHVA